MRLHTFLLPFLCAVLFLACTKNPDQTKAATKLNYAEPTSSGWRFSKVSGTGSASDPLILELRGPEGMRVKGVSLLLDLDHKAVTLHPLQGSRYVVQSPSVNLGNGQRLIFDKLESDCLHCGVFQKTGDTDAGQGIFRIALKLKDDKQPMDEITGFSIRQSAMLDGTNQQTSPSIAFGVIQAK